MTLAQAVGLVALGVFLVALGALLSAVNTHRKLEDRVKPPRERIVHAGHGHDRAMGYRYRARVDGESERWSVTIDYSHMPGAWVEHRYWNPVTPFIPEQQAGLADQHFYFTREAAEARGHKILDDIAAPPPGEVLSERPRRR